MKRQESPSRKATTATTTANITPGIVALEYLRVEQLVQILPVSKRTVSNWQARRLIKFYRVGRTILFRRSDIESALEKFAVNPIGELKPRQQNVEASTITTQTPKPPRKRRAGRIQPEPPVTVPWEKLK